LYYNESEIFSQNKNERGGDMNFSKKIKLLRKSKGITQEALSDMVAVDRSSVAKWETGKALPSHDIMLRLSRIFDVSINELLEESDSRLIKTSELSEAETAFLVAYRAHPEMHEAIRRRLGIETKQDDMWLAAAPKVTPAIIDLDSDKVDITLK
jgi:transcriptional regulator with XRE-family HTH domain